MSKQLSITANAHTALFALSQFNNATMVQTAENVIMFYCGYGLAPPLVEKFMRQAKGVNGMTNGIQRITESNGYKPIRLKDEVANALHRIKYSNSISYSEALLLCIGLYQDRHKVWTKFDGDIVLPADYSSVMDDLRDLFPSLDARIKAEMQLYDNAVIQRYKLQEDKQPATFL